MSSDRHHLLALTIAHDVDKFIIDGNMVGLDHYVKNYVLSDDSPSSSVAMLRTSFRVRGNLPSWSDKLQATSEWLRSKGIDADRKLSGLSAPVGTYSYKPIRTFEPNLKGRDVVVGPSGAVTIGVSLSS